MIAIEKDDGILRKTSILDCPQLTRYPSIHQRNLVIILRPVTADRVGIRVVGRERHLGGIVCRRFRGLVQTAFVGDAMVEDTEERLREGRAKATAKQQIINHRFHG